MAPSAKDFLRREGWPFVIACTLVYMGFLIQVTGISLTDKDLRPVIRDAPFYWRYIGKFGLDLSTIAPFLSIAALYIALTPVAYETPDKNRNFLWGIVVVAVLLSFVEFYWTWSAAATWLRGFLG
jgi:hypothetical protein